MVALTPAPLQLIALVATYREDIITRTDYYNVLIIQGLRFHHVVKNAVTHISHLATAHLSNTQLQDDPDLVDSSAGPQEARLGGSRQNKIQGT